MTWRLIRISGNILSLFLTCFTVGTGIGFILGEIVARTWERPAQIDFAEGAAAIGGGAACVVGPILYYIVLGRRVSFEEFASTVAFAAVVGFLVSLTGSEFITSTVPVAGAVLAAIAIKVRRDT
jgi:hypothetical protein